MLVVLARGGDGEGSGGEWRGGGGCKTIDLSMIITWGGRGKNDKNNNSRKFLKIT